MVDDLRRQASEIYRERNKEGALRTSESLSLKKLTYIAIALAIVLLVAIQFFGGFETRPDPVKAAATPAPLVKEAPSPEMLEPIETTSPPAVTPKPEPPKPPPAPAVAAKPAPVVNKPAASPAPAVPDVAKKAPAPEPKPAAAPVADSEPVDEPEPEAVEDPPEPEISAEEMARRELARDMIIQSSSAMAELILLPGNQEWEAAEASVDTYMVTFIIMEDSQPVRYVWRVNMGTKSVTPLSYYARKLP
jgi:hypothetical protein